MKNFAFVSLWIVIWGIAFVIKVFLGDFMDGVEIARTLKSLIMAVPTGVCTGIGVALHNKLKIYFKKKIRT